MAFSTSADIQGGYYGRWVTQKGESSFKKLGKAITLQAIYESIENDKVYYKLSCDYLGRTKYLYVQREQITEPTLMKDLAAIGGDVTRRDFDILVDTLRLQEHDMEIDGSDPIPAYASLGWIKLPTVDDDGELDGFELYYRAHELVGTQCPAKYIGNYDVEPVGDYEVWRQMVEADVVQYPALQFILVVALAAVVLGVLAQTIPIENPIVHINYPSGKGKSTAGYLAASTAGRPFDGTRTIVDEDGKVVELESIYQSWGATDNAMVSTQAGNRGVVTVLNELGKSLTKNMTRLIFDLSEGSDKKRLTTTLEARVSKGYSTTFISTGESSLLEKCDSKAEGLSVRVMEITKPITKDAEHANRIKEVCSTNCGHAAPKMAQYILDNGGVDFVLPRYKRWVKKLRVKMPATPSMERFVEKFAALFMVTVEIATDALGIDFDKESLLRFLFVHEEENGDKRNTAASSYDIVLEQCRINLHLFHVRNHKSVTKGKNKDELAAVAAHQCWGRITNMMKPYGDGRVVVQEFEVRKSIVERILKEKGFDNKSTCIAAWKAADVLEYEDEYHPTRSRKIDASAPKGATEDVYVFRVFADAETEDTLLAEIQANQRAEDSRAEERRTKRLKLQNAVQRQGGEESD